MNPILYRHQYQVALRNQEKRLDQGCQIKSIGSLRRNLEEVLVRVVEEGVGEAVVVVEAVVAVVEENLILELE